MGIFLVNIRQCHLPNNNIDAVVLSYRAAYMARYSTLQLIIGKVRRRGFDPANSGGIKTFKTTLDYAYLSAPER